MKVRSFIFCVPAFLLLLISCRKDPVLFELIPAQESGVSFRNDLGFDPKFNIYTYRNYYNGGGVAIGDINNDGLPDIYVTGNLVPNKLYLNKGNFQFEDITEKAGVAGTRAWSTGVTMVDINGDGLLDIYVCNSGDITGDNKQNELFINNGDLTFTESAEAYGLADQGFSTHAVFFDYDKDGDLDVYLLNNSYQSIGSFNLMKNIRDVRDSVGGDKLYRNDGGKFVDVSAEAGIYGSVIGFGLGATVGDVNGNGWPDLFISNDFFEMDYLYINNQDGTFTEVLQESMPSISAASMGADMADINNNGRPDIFVTDMLPEPDARRKQVTLFENWDKISYNVTHGYHYQYTRNMLHFNNGDGTFSDIGRLAGVEATDWSWAPLIFDMDNDGWKDIFVANGIYQDITDLDYLNFIDDPKTKKQIISKQGVDYKALVDPIPITPVPNYAFHNQGNLRFVNKAKDWGLGTPMHSNGSAYGDLNNDGTLDLVINNVNDQLMIYKNNARTLYPKNNFIKLNLKGEGMNTYAVGAQVHIKAGEDYYYQEQMPTRGFQSSVDPVLIVGVGHHTTLDEVRIKWPDFKETVLRNVLVNQVLEVLQKDAGQVKPPEPSILNNKYFKDITADELLDFRHKENDFVDFDRDRLIYHMLSTQGPKMAVSDINGDGLDDIYFCGAKDQPGKLFIQNKSGGFELHPDQTVFESDARSEDVNAVFVDVNNDGFPDLLVASGGNEFGFGTFLLRDRLYINDGTGSFSKSTEGDFTERANNTAVIRSFDLNGNGFKDVFTGSRILPFQYGLPADGFIYLNDGKGNLLDKTDEIAPELKKLGMITDAVWADYDGDGDEDLIITGQWMGIEIFENNGGKLTRKTEALGLNQFMGWWNTIIAEDMNGDGLVDFILGNHGLNSRFKASKDQPVVMLVKDFDQNGTIEHIYARYIGDKIFPYALKHDMVAQMPGLKKNFLKYEQYNSKSVDEIFTTDQLEGATRHEANYLESAILINRGGGEFELKALPVEAQFSPVFGIYAEDFDGDGHIDILLGGNFYEAKPEAGRYDAGYGLLLKGKGNFEFEPILQGKSGFFVKGAIRQILPVNTSAGRLIIVTLNDDRVRVFKPQ